MHLNLAHALKFSTFTRTIKNLAYIVYVINLLNLYIYIIYSTISKFITKNKTFSKPVLLKPLW